MIPVFSTSGSTYSYMTPDLINDIFFPKTTAGSASNFVGTMSNFELYSISTVSTSYPLFKFEFTTSN